MFKKKFPSLSSLGSDGNTAFLRAARAGHLDKVLEHLKANIDINTSNTNGLNALHLASKDGHVGVVTELLKRGAVVDSATKKGNTALHIASLAGQEDVVKLLVASGAAVNVQSQNGFTPLYMAAQENHDNVVRFLLANGANQSLATEDGFTPLAVAMQQGHDKVVAVLLENDTRGKVRLPALHIAAKKDDCKAAALLLQNEHNPDVTSKSGFTPLHIAAHYGNEGIANLLLNKGADVNYSAKHNISPLHVAAKWGKTNLVSLLLEKGATIESKTRDGLTPLHCAARSGHEQVVDMMLERGAPISSKTKNGLAPLHMAAQGDHVDAARILLYHKAPVDDVTVDYLTALHVAAHCGHVRVAKLLLDRKADPNSRALNGFTPLHIACKKNRIKVVELLLKHGGSIEATTESGLTPLHVASFMGCMNIVIFLLQNDASPDIPTVRGETPLHLAARANQTDIIRILLRNGAQVDARAREQQTPLHIASRLGNVDIVMLLLQHGAAVDSTTKDMYTALHIAAKEGQEEVASVLLEHGASLTATTKKGFTPLHLAAKYGNIKVAKLLLQKEAPVDAQGKNGVTPLHVASHYDHQNVALLLLDKGASPHATAKNGHTPLHIAARKNQMDIATTLLEYGAKANAESKAGFTPLHLSAQEGHTDMSTLLIEHGADTNHKAKNGLTPLHLCAQEDRVNVSTILVKNGAQVDSTTKAGYTPLHVASHFGQVNMIRFLVMNGADVGAATSVGYTPLHQAAQQGHTTVVGLLLEKQAPPNLQTNQGQTPLCIAQKLGYISVVETLKGVTEPTVTNGSPAADEKYRVVAPETMQETFMSDSEDEGGEDTMLSDQPYRYLTVDEMKSLGDDSLPIDVTRDERIDSNRECMAPPQAVDDTISPQHVKESYAQFASHYAADNIDISRHPVNVGFLVSFLVDARGGAMRGCRHSGVRVIVPPRKAAQPMRVTCRYLKRDKLAYPPPLMEGEALASRILELGPVGGKFLGPVVIEVPHFGSLRGTEREIVILRSDNGETWREHTLEASDEAVHDVMSESFEADEVGTALEDPSAGRTTRILTADFPQYFAVVSRIRQEVHAIGPDGGMVSSSVVPQVQAVFPQGALTKKIKVGLQAQPIPAELAAKLLGNRVAVSPIVTVEPRRRKFHKPITLTIPVPRAANKGMINQYSGEAPTLRLLCSITGGTTRAQWEDVTGSTPFTFVNDCVSFTTTVSARFWLMDCRNIADATKMATELYREAIHVPFMAKFVVFAKRTDVSEARLRVFCMTDDKEDKTLEHQEHFIEVAKSRDVEVLEGKMQYVEFSGNLVPVTKSGDQLQLGFRAFRENRLPFTVRVKDPHADTVGRAMFMREGRVAKGEPPQQPICVLNIVLPGDIVPEPTILEADLLALNKKYSFLRDGGLGRLESYQRTNLRLSDISNLIGSDWVPLAHELDVSTSDVNSIKSDFPDSVPQQAMSMLRLWLQQAGNKANGNTLETALRKIGRDDIVQQCIFNVDQVDRPATRVHTLSQSREGGVRRNVSLDAAYDEQDIMKESESVEELVQAERTVPSDRRQYSDEGESKYVGEEKVVVEEQKSVSELKEIFAQDKRDRQYERQPSVGSTTSKEEVTTSTTTVRPASMVEKTTTKRTTTTDERPRSVVVERTVETSLPEAETFTVEEIRQKFSSSQPESITTVTKVTKKVVTSAIPVTPEMAKKTATAKAEIVEKKAEAAMKKVTEVVESEAAATKPPAEKASGIPKMTAKAGSREGTPPKTSEFTSKSVQEVTVTTKTSGIPVVTKTTKVVETVKQVVDDATGSAELRRDSALFQGVSEELGRLETTFRVEQAQDGILSPKVSKTPPPSPAEFNREQNGASQQSWSTGGALSTELQPTMQEWSEKSRHEKDVVQSGKSSSIVEDVVLQQASTNVVATESDGGSKAVEKPQEKETAAADKGKPVKHVQFSPQDQIMTTAQFLRQESENYDIDRSVYAIPEALKVAGLVAGTVSVPREFPGDEECVKRGICEALEVAGKVAGNVSVPRDLPGDEPPKHGLSEALEVAGKVAGTIPVPRELPEEEPAKRGILEALEVAGKVAGTVPIHRELPGEDGIDGKPVTQRHIFEALETAGDIAGVIPTHRKLSLSETKIEGLIAKTEEGLGSVGDELKTHHIFEALEKAGDVVGAVPTHRRLSTSETKIEEGKHRGVVEGLELLGKLAGTVPLHSDISFEEKQLAEAGEKVPEEVKRAVEEELKIAEHVAEAGKEKGHKKVAEEMKHLVDVLSKVSDEVKLVAEEKVKPVEVAAETLAASKVRGMPRKVSEEIKDVVEEELRMAERITKTESLQRDRSMEALSKSVADIPKKLAEEIANAAEEELEIAGKIAGLQRGFSKEGGKIKGAEVPKSVSEEVTHVVEQELEIAGKIAGAVPVHRDISREDVKVLGKDVHRSVSEEVTNVVEKELEIAGQIAGAVPLQRDISREDVKTKGAEFPSTKSVSEEVSHVVERELEIAGKIAGAAPLHGDISKGDIRFDGSDVRESISEEVTRVVTQELDASGNAAGSIPLHRETSVEDLTILGQESVDYPEDDLTRFVERELVIPSAIPGGESTHQYATSEEHTVTYSSPSGFTEQTTRIVEKEVDIVGDIPGAVCARKDVSSAGHKIAAGDVSCLAEESKDEAVREGLGIAGRIAGSVPMHEDISVEETKHFVDEVDPKKALHGTGHGIGEALETAGLVAGAIPTRKEIIHGVKDAILATTHDPKCDEAFEREVEVVGSMKLSPLTKIRSAKDEGIAFGVQHSSTVIEVTRRGGGKGDEKGDESSDSSYVTTPTLPRRELGFGGSQRLTRDQRPAPLDVTNQPVDGDSDEDGYVVTEPADESLGVASPTTGIPRRRPLFHIESEEDDLADMIVDFAANGLRQDFRTLPGDVQLTEVDNETYDNGFSMRFDENVKVTDIDAEDEDDENVDGQVVKGFMKVGPMGELMKGVERLKETVTEKAVDGGKVVEKTVEIVQVMQSEGKGIVGGLDDSFSDEFERALGIDDEDDPKRSDDEKDDGDEKMEKKLRRVERRFERMASETLCREIDESTSAPEAELRREAEFQRMLSQLSTDEVIESQKDFSQLWEEGGVTSMTPSEEWDSAPKTGQDTPSHPEIDEDSPQQVASGEVAPPAILTKVSYNLSNIPLIVIDNCDSDDCDELYDTFGQPLSDISDEEGQSYRSEDFDEISLYTSDDDDNNRESFPVAYIDFTNPKYDKKTETPDANWQQSSSGFDSDHMVTLEGGSRNSESDCESEVKEGTLVQARRKSSVYSGPNLRRSTCSLEESPLGDAISEWAPRETESTTTTTTTTITRGAEGLIPQGATGGVSVTTTETRVVEGSAEMKELLEKMAAESRK